jgi:uncharacterized membrane protein YedE/YeeE
MKLTQFPLTSRPHVQLAAKYGYLFLIFSQNRLRIGKYLRPGYICTGFDDAGPPMLQSVIPDTISSTTATVLFGVLLGLGFGALAQRSHFCLRRALVGEEHVRREAMGVWGIALAVSVTGTTLLVASGLVDFSKHRLLASQAPVLALTLGGALFGAGMVLARGCASRLTVLAAGGNLRALVTVVVLAIVAHATLKGALAPVRGALSAFTIDLGSQRSLATLPGGIGFWAAVAVAGLLAFAARSGAKPGHLVAGAAIGALAPLGWLGTGVLLADEFHPVPLESMGFTAAATEGLFWMVASSALKPTFGVGFLGGVLLGAFLAAAASRTFALEGFGDDVPTGRYLAGGALMGVGGALAGGCTVGAGLVGVGLLSLQAILALGGIAAGALATDALLRRSRAVALLPAE